MFVRRCRRSAEVADVGVLVVVVAQLGELTHLVAHFAVHAQVAIDIDAAIRLDGYGAVILEDDVVGLVAVKRRFAFLYGGAVLAVACNADNHVPKFQEENARTAWRNGNKAELLHQLAAFDIATVRLGVYAAKLARDILAARNNTCEKFHHKAPPGWSSRRVRFPFCLSRENVTDLMR